MPFKPNYRAHRADRDRAKDERKKEKLQRLEEKVAKRKALREGEPGSEGEPAGEGAPQAEPG